MKHLLPFSLFSFFFLAAQGQNLVPNPSFEEFSECPTSAGRIDLADHWFIANSSNPDLFSTCGQSDFVGVPSNFMGNESSEFGNSYTNVCTYYQLTGQSYREYLGVQLTNPLTPNTKYFFSLVISLSDSSRYSTSSLGVHFTQDSLTDSGFDYLPLIPQIELGGTFDETNKVGWEQASSSFVANGTEEFLTIGNFQSDSNSGLQPLVDGGNGSNPDFASAHYYIDYVCLSSDSMDCALLTSVLNFNDSRVRVYPNPCNELLFIDGLERGELIRLFDAGGRMAFEGFAEKMESVQLPTRNLPNGIYFLASGTIRKQILINH